LTTKVAAITGAASGMGLAMAQRFAAEGIKVSLADVEAGPLDRAVQDLRDAGHDAIGVVTDVRDPDAVQCSASRTLRSTPTAPCTCCATTPAS